MIAGDSAGGSISLLVAQKIRDKALPQPCCIVSISPWLDLSLSGESISTLALHDVLLNPVVLISRHLATLAAGPNIPLDHPSVSPLFGSFQDLPPIFFLVGSEEILLSDTLRARARASTFGVKTRLELGSFMFHVYPLYNIPEGFEARQDMKLWWDKQSEINRESCKKEGKV